MASRPRCNKCGEVIDQTVYDDYLFVSVIWGYYSPWDGTKDEWCMCTSCYKKLIDTFVIPPRQIDIF